MPEEELRAELEAGVVFHGCEVDGRLVGVMGSQDVKDVTLIRHAYVLSSNQRQGVGGLLLGRMLALTERPVLVGTWEAARWAVGFYETHGFSLITSRRRTLALLSEYWSVPVRQMRSSVVLVDSRWSARESHRAAEPG